ncbi:MAG: LuxR C-terminal-related transcriptional regulator [Kocuria sp.]|nr:LuxR C-terminal-related transcriptional regulator [Kocuria sp.]
MKILTEALPVKLPSRSAFVQNLVTPWEWDTLGPSTLLTGAQGVGKTVLLDDICTALEPMAQVIRWWEYPLMEGHPHPAPGFAAALCAGDDARGSGVLQAFRRARSWIKQNNTDFPLLVVLDDVHLVPEIYRHVLVELARSRELSLLVASTSVRLTGAAMSQLWRDGELTEHRIPELTAGDVMEMARSVLGREPDASEIAKVLRISQAVVGHAVVALKDLASSSTETGEGGGLQPGTDRAMLLQQALHTRTLDPDQLSILQVLARLREVPSSILVSLFDAHNLDVLVENGVICLHGRGASRGVVMTNSWIAILVTDVTPAERDRELYELLADYRHDPRMRAGASADLLLWQHSLGLPLDPDRVAELAELAAQNADYGTVHRLIRTLDGQDAARLHGLHTLALASLGQVDAAVELAKPLLEQQPDPQNPLEARDVEALYVLAAMSTQQRRKVGDFEHLLGIARGHHNAMYDQSSYNLAQSIALEEAALSAQWVLENYRGDYQTLLDSIARASAARTVERTTRALMVGLTAKANAVCGRSVDGQAILSRTVRVDRTARNARLAQQHTQDAAMVASLFAGEWARLLERVLSQDAGIPDTPGWVQHNVLLGTLLMLTGRPGKAVRYLETAMAAADSRTMFHVPHLLIGLTSAAYAWVGRHDEAWKLLQTDHASSTQGSYLYRVAGEYFLGLAEFLLGDVAAGIQRWRSWADDTAERGCDGLCLLFLQGLARAGSEFAVQELRTTASRCQGAWAESLGQLAQALEHQKITDLRAALRSAAAMGDLSLVGYLERTIAARGHTTSAGPVIPFPDDGSEDMDTGEVDARAVSLVAVLTAREREIADLAAAGLTNQAIAEEVGLSRRTVEGHMRQVLRKLNLTRRTELVDLWKGVQA